MKDGEQRLSIGSMAATTGASADTLRYYERIGLMPEVPRRSNGQRAYGERHVRWVGMLQRLRAVGMPIARMTEYVSLARDGAETLEQRVQLLEEHRAALEGQMGELTEFLEILERKIRLHQESRPGADCLKP